MELGAVLNLAVNKVTSYCMFIHCNNNAELKTVFADIICIMVNIPNKYSSQFHRFTRQLRNGYKSLVEGCEEPR